MPAKQGCLSRRNAAGVRFHREFLELRKIERLPHVVEQEFQLRGCQRGGCSPAEKDGAWHNRHPPGRGVNFGCNRLAKSGGIRAIEQVLVKCAVWANSGAERNMNVKMLNGACDSLAR